MKLNFLIEALKSELNAVPELDQNIDVTGISHDSRSLKKGEIFVALTGGSFDGHKFIDDAIANGAAAIVGERDLDGLPIPYFRVANSRKALAQFSAAYFGFPAKALTVIGVTGTDGKTTTVNLIHHILVSCGLNAGMVSTVNARIGNELIDTGFHVTTPEAQKVQALLRKIVDGGQTHVVLEATSHGLEQSRVDECYFDIAVVTNITHEHLDYHGDYNNYLNAKAKLFTGLVHDAQKPLGQFRRAILNHDDISYNPLLDILDKDEYKEIDIFRYGTNDLCDLLARNIQSTKDGLKFDLIYKDKKYPVHSTLIGEYNAHNIMAAVGATAVALGIDLESVIHAINTFLGVPGRMENILLGQDFMAIVDFAHTPNALKVALETSRKRTPARVIAVFGSAGLRDREKRRMMAEVSIAHADITILTAEDPRTESLDMILAEMEDEAVKNGGLKDKTFFTVADRGEAIRQAVKIAQENDLVIICGKGHEQSMCFGEIEYPWDDRTALRSALADLLGLDGPDMPYLPTQDN